MEMLLALPLVKDKQNEVKSSSFVMLTLYLSAHDFLAESWIHDEAKICGLSTDFRFPWNQPLQLRTELNCSPRKRRTAEWPQWILFTTWYQDFVSLISRFRKLIPCYF